MEKATAADKKEAETIVNKMLGLDAEFEKQKTQGDAVDQCMWKIAKKYKEKAAKIFVAAYIKNKQ